MRALRPMRLTGLLRLLSTLGLAASLTACVTQPPAPTPRPIQSSGMKCPLPTYPNLARRLGVEGRVAVRLKVELDGSVSEALIVETAAANRKLNGMDMAAVQELDRAALNMGRACRFGAVTGQHTPALVRIPVEFRLE